MFINRLLLVVAEVVPFAAADMTAVVVVVAVFIIAELGVLSTWLAAPDDVNDDIIIII